MFNLAPGFAPHQLVIVPEDFEPFVAGTVAFPEFKV
jgi:hypothetical protein